MTGYRVTIEIPDLPVPNEFRWGPLLNHLEHIHGDLGPVLGWTDDIAHIIVSLPADDEAHAADIVTTVIVDSLHMVGLGHLYPTSLDVRDARAEDEAITTA